MIQGKLKTNSQITCKKRDKKNDNRSDIQKAY